MIRIGVRLLGPLLLVAVLWRIEEPRRLLEVLSKSSWPVLFGAALLNAVNIHLKVMRWQVLLGTRGHRYPTGRAWRAILPSMYIGMLTPGRVGDVLRVQYMRRDLGMSYPEGLAIVVMDRFCDLYVLLGFVGFGVAHFAHVLTGQLGFLTWVAVIVTAVAPLGLLVRGPVDRFLAAVYRRVAKQRSREGADQFLSALRAQLGRGLLTTVPLTVGAFSVQYFQGWLAAGAMGMNLGPADVTGMLAITSLLSLLPISMSGVGVREAFLALVFPALALTAAQGVAFGLVMFSVVYVATMAAGFVAWQIAPPPFGRDTDTPAPS